MPISKETIEKWNNKSTSLMEALNCGLIFVSEWEEDFIASVYKQVTEGRELSMKQSLTLNKLYSKLE